MMTEKNIVHGIAPIEEIPEGTAGQQIYQALLTYRDLPDAVINVEKNYSISFNEILEQSVKLAVSLQQCGYGRENILAICSENSVFYYYPLLAGLYLGIPVAPINQDYIKDELHHAINLSKPSLIFCSLKNVEKILELKSVFPCIERIIVLDLDDAMNDAESFNDFIKNNLPEHYDIATFKPCEFDRDEQVAVILCSSGTTGLPKGVMLTHKNVICRLIMTRDERFAYTMGNNKTTICVIPIFHAAGFAVVLHQLILGYKLILMDKFNPELYLQTIQDYKIDTIFVVPAIIGFLARSPRVQHYNISCLKLIVCSAAPLLSKVEQLALHKLPSLEGIAQAYGLTEALAGVFMPLRGEYRTGSSGKLLPLLSAKIVDLNTGETLGHDQEGELYIKGGVIMKGYINTEDEVLGGIDKEGWLRTGDVAYYDKQEYFYIVDRIKELIKFKGFQVPPAQLESLLLQHPDLRDTGVVGVPDEDAGELPTAFVVKLPETTVTEKDLIEFIAGKVSDSKRLRGGVHFIDELPRNQNGKLLRRELRQKAIELSKCK